MSLLVETDVPAAVELDVTDAADAQRVAQRLLAAAGSLVDAPEWVRAARAAWDELPVGLRRPLRAWRRESGPRGALLLRGIPVGVDTLPATPSVDGSVQREATVAASMLMMIAAGLGDPAAFRPEKTGALVQDVVAVPGKEDFQGNAGSVLLSFHTENAFHKHRPDFVMLLCLRADPENVAGLRTACVRQVLPLLSTSSREALWRPEFVTLPPPSFGSTDECAPAHAVLTGDADDPNLVVDFAATTALTQPGVDALAELQELFGARAQTHLLVPGDLAIVDNRVTVHGRTAFSPRYDGMDRWLQRTFVLADLRRSRGHRPGDGYVLAF